VDFYRPCVGDEKTDEERRYARHSSRSVTLQKTLHFRPHSSSVSLTLASFPPGEAFAAARPAAENNGKMQKFLDYPAKIHYNG
jgi:hypothetical protein